MAQDLNLLTIEEAANYLSVSKISLRRWTNSGRLRCFRVGVRGQRRFSKAELEKFLAEEGTAPRQAATAARHPGVDAPWSRATAARADGDNHISLHFSNTEDQYRMFHPYLLKHVRLGAPILYIHDSTPRARLMSLMRAEGIDPDQLMGRGLLRLIPSTDAYLRSGGFSADRTLAFIENATREMLSGASTKALLTGEMSWYFSGAKGVAGILEYERRVNRLTAKYPGVTLICQYSIKRFDSAMTLGALCAHPVVELPDRTVRGFYNAHP